MNELERIFLKSRSYVVPQFRSYVVFLCDVEELTFLIIFKHYRERKQNPGSKCNNIICYVMKMLSKNLLEIGKVFLKSTPWPYTTLSSYLPTTFIYLFPLYAPLIPLGNDLGVQPISGAINIPVKYEFITCLKDCILTGVYTLHNLEYTCMYYITN